MGNKKNKLLYDDKAPNREFATPDVHVALKSKLKRGDIK